MHQHLPNLCPQQRIDIEQAIHDRTQQLKRAVFSRCVHAKEDVLKVKALLGDAVGVWSKGSCKVAYMRWLMERRTRTLERRVVCCLKNNLMARGCYMWHQRAVLQVWS